MRFNLSYIPHSCVSSIPCLLLSKPCNNLKEILKNNSGEMTLYLTPKKRF